MAWYAAHAIFYFKLNSGVQDCFTIYENVYLIEANNNFEASQKAEEWAKFEEQANSNSRTTVNDEPAKMIFAGIRKIIEDGANKSSLNVER